VVTAEESAAALRKNHEGAERLEAKHKGLPTVKRKWVTVKVTPQTQTEVGTFLLTYTDAWQKIPALAARLTRRALGRAEVCAIGFWVGFSKSQ